MVSLRSGTDTEDERGVEATSPRRTPRSRGKAVSRAAAQSVEGVCFFSWACPDQLDEAVTPVLNSWAGFVTTLNLSFLPEQRRA